MSRLRRDTWRLDVKTQVKTVQLFWPEVSIPPPPDFQPLTATEILVLHVVKPCEDIWDCLMPSQGVDLAKIPADLDYQALDHVRPYQSAVSWIGFDPYARIGVSPESVKYRLDLPGAEVLSALMHYRLWPRTCLQTGAPMPLLAGLRHQGKVPRLEISSKTKLARISLVLEDASFHGPNFGIPSVRRLVA